VASHASTLDPGLILSTWSTSSIPPPTKQGVSLPHSLGERGPQEAESSPKAGEGEGPPLPESSANSHRREHCKQHARMAPGGTSPATARYSPPGSSRNQQSMATQALQGNWRIGSSETQQMPAGACEPVTSQVVPGTTAKG
jgi:hypothetical protein